MTMEVRGGMGLGGGEGLHCKKGVRGETPNKGNGSGSGSGERGPPGAPGAWRRWSHPLEPLAPLAWEGRQLIQPLGARGSPPGNCTCASACTCLHLHLGSLASTSLDSVDSTIDSSHFLLDSSCCV